ncbi:thioredoxin domain-containing protein [Streptomyces sp. UNOC14_S4]|uniref:thioredoxin domain-containing protein n=1 Tax=Streptomyces sp. UNOC14_S4 TaxID=2872340 RepID=UPI001E28C8DC|nr:thioredoxin domain-containing protein [Streptomyces sp. UNOC14_S4]MCC3770285.1 DsbA family protein [Streptomyces sp. UNOC14_S4]
MSNRNSHQNKQAARERLRAERERQAKKDRTRRQLLVGGSVVAVLAVAAGIGVAVTKMGKDDTVSAAWSAAAKKDLVKPANTAGDKGTEIVIGDKNAKHTLDLFQDMRCPICSTFEQFNGDTIDKDVKDGKYKVSYHIATFLDRNLPGTGSKNALSALGAALNVSPEAFSAYNKALYSKANHPDETKDSFAKDDVLLKIANQVPQLKDNKDFEKNVKDGTFDKWALEVSDEFDSHKDVTGTPTLKIDGKKLTSDGKNTPIAPDQFTKAVTEALKS